MTNINKPTAAVVASADQTLEFFVKVYEALRELQGAADAVTPASAAAKAGASQVVFVPGATVKDPNTGVTFTANVYAYAVKT